jgi:exosortase K
MNYTAKVIPISIVVLIFVLLKLWYRHANEADLHFVLYPTDKVFNLISGSSSECVSERGYVHQDLHIIIEKSCSGFNFLLLCFVVLSYSVIRNFDRIEKVLKYLLPILVFSWLFTIFVNCSRILFSVRVHHSSANDAGGRMHEMEGAFIYLSFLIGIYLLFEYLIKKTKTNYAKSPSS